MTNCSLVDCSLEKQKSQLIDALVKKGVAIVDLLNSVDGVDSTSDAITIKPSDVDEVYFDLLKLTDSNDSKVSQFIEKHAELRKDYGRAIKSLMKQLETKPSPDVETRLIEQFTNCGWTELARFAKRTFHVKYPKSYRLF